MTKQEMTVLLRSVGVNENTITAMENAYEMGVEAEREACAKLCEDSQSPPDWNSVAVLWKECKNKLATAIRARRDEVTYGEATSRGQEQEGLWLGKEAEAKAWQKDKA